MEAAQKLEPQAQFSISIEKNILLKSIAKLQSIVEKRNTIPILSNVKLEAANNALKLTVTDMDLVASEEIEATVNQDGAITVPALTLYDIVRKLPEGSQVNLEIDDGSSRLIVTSGTSRFNLSYLPAEDFPVMSEGTLSHSFKLSADVFLKLIEKTRFAMSNEETRYYLNGVYFHINGSNLRAVATDGHRLASVELELPQGAQEMPGIIIPRKAVNEIGKLLENQEEVTIALSDAKIKFNAGKVELLSKVVDGTFPDYQRVIPENNNKGMAINTESLKSGVDRVSTIAADKTRAVKFALSANKVTLSSQGIEGTSAKEEVDAEYSSDELEIGFNSRYVLEMLGQVESETVRIAFDTPNSPALVTDPSDPTVLFIVMPMRV
jgi:DNA polymerase-3 subunit beta